MNQQMPPNPELARAMQELRRSSAAQKHKNRKKYDRKSQKRQINKEME